MTKRLRDAANAFGSDASRFALNKLSVTQDRFLLTLRMARPGVPGLPLARIQSLAIRDVIHVPGTARKRVTRPTRWPQSGANFPGTFDNYVASVILAWQKERSATHNELNA